MNSERLSYLALGVDVANVGSDTCRVRQLSIDAAIDATKLTGCKADIVERELANPRVELQQQRQRLANATSSTQNRHLRRLQLSISASLSRN